MFSSATSLNNQPLVDWYVSSYLYHYDLDL
jgi:hypothetical protein